MTFSKLGTDTDSNQLVNLPKSARFQGLYIIGMQRMGKSGLIENLIMEDINQQIGVCVLDPHGELIDHVIARLDPKHEKDVILLDIKNYHYPFGLNLFTCADLNNPLEVQKTVDQVRHIFEKLLGVSAETPLILEYLRNCTYTLVANPGYTMADIPLLLQDEQCRRTLVANVTDPDVLLFWKRYERMKPSEQDVQAMSILRRVQEFLQSLTRPIVGQSTTTIDFRRIMDERKILLVRLDRTLDAVTSLIGSIIVALILNTSTARQTQRQFHLYADEFQNFATEDFVVLLEQAAKWAIGVTMAHQNRSQLELSNKQADANLKARTLNVGNIVVFRVPTDAEELAGQFDTTPPPAKEEDITIIDGTEPILTPVKDVFHHLLSGGSHPTSDVVNQFATTTLLKLRELTTDWNRSDLWNALNNGCYKAMIHKDIYTSPPIKELLEANALTGAGSRMVVDIFLGSTMYTLPAQQSPRFANPADWPHSSAFAYACQLWNTPPTGGATHIIQQLENLAFSECIAFVNYNKQKDPRWRSVDQAQYVALQASALSHVIDYIVEFRAVLEALADEPIREKSGFEQPRKRIQHVVHAQQSHADKEKEIAGHLLHLQPYTAWVKLGMNAPQNPGKKCLKCGHRSQSGAKFCQQCGTQLPALNEYRIETLPPTKGLYGKALQDRIVRIQAQNRKDGYTRARADVEAEIIKRQTNCSGASAPAQAQSPQQQPPRHARQVPVQGKCQNCGAANPPGSKFCNQCGAKL